MPVRPQEEGGWYLHRGPYDMARGQLRLAMKLIQSASRLEQTAGYPRLGQPQVGNTQDLCYANKMRSLLTPLKRPLDIRGAQTGT
jgi:hypothetical protein